MHEASTPDDRAPRLSRRERELGRMSFAFLLDQVSTGVGHLSTLDALLVLAINQANITPLTREPLARIRYGRMDAAAPDTRRRPVSVNAVATSLGVPFETVRRRVRELEKIGACARVEGGVIVPEAFLTSPSYVQTVEAGHRRLREFYYAAAAAGLVEELPRSAYPPEPSIPVRAAARLLSDYVLRTAAILMFMTGDVISVIVLLAAADAKEGVTSIADVARRLQLPPETVRRHAVKLVELGHCAKSREGLSLPEAVLERPAWRAFLEGNVANVQRLFAGLAERGVIEAWSRLAPPLRIEGAIAARSSPPGG